MYRPGASAPAIAHPWTAQRRYDRSAMEDAARPFVLASFGYRRLAARVITQALHDLRSSSVDDQKSAQTFLSGSEMLCFWCDLAEIQPAYVVARAATFVSSSRPATGPLPPLPV